MSNPIFSIITPTYNCAEFIFRSYNLLKNQTENSWEWIVVDDGSTDASSELFQSINDNRIVFVSYKDNKGRGYARNVGLKKATGKIIVIWDIDDIYFPNRLEIIKNKINNYDFFASKAIIVDNDLNIKGVRGFDKNKLYTGFVHPTLAFSSTVKNSINYNEEMTAGEDFESMIFLTNNCKGFFYEEPLMLYVEDREVNLNKTLISNTSHLNTIIKVYNQKISKIDTFSYFFRVIKLKLKILILKTFKIYPKLYLFTIKYRDINTDPKEYKRYVPEINKLKTQLVK